MSKKKEISFYEEEIYFEVDKSEPVPAWQPTLLGLVVLAAFVLVAYLTFFL